MPNKLKADEHACRISYLFQAGAAISHTSVPQLAEHYGNTLVTISEKTPAKRDFTIKRFMCKTCRTVLIPGTTASYRLQRKRKCRAQPTVILTCLSCSTSKRLPANPNYQLQYETLCKIETRGNNDNEPKASTTY